jgi:hypothetical protein
MDKVAMGQVFLRVLRFLLSITFHRNSPYSYVIWGMNNRRVESKRRGRVVNTAASYSGGRCSNLGPETGYPD